MGYADIRKLYTGVCASIDVVQTVYSELHLYV